MHNTSQSTIFPDASLSILLQMAPLKRSDEMMDCYITNYGERAEFDRKEIPAWPLPERIAAGSSSSSSSGPGCHSIAVMGT